MKIALVISHLGCGGQERVMCLMANYWAKVGNDTHLMTISRGGDTAFSISPLVRRCSAQDGLKGRSILHKLWTFRRNLTETNPDVIISFGHKTNVITLVASLKLGIPVIVSERNHPDYCKISKFFAAGRRLLYPRFATLVLQTKDIDNWFASRGYSCPRAIIPNPIEEVDGRDCEVDGSTLPEKFWVTVGRLSPQKGHDRLLRIFRRVEWRRSGWKLLIVGEGKERSKLERLIAELELTEVVKLLGHHSNPNAILKYASGFVFSSNYEGFPNALCEAMAAGLPVISFDCASGPADIIENNSNGILVANGDHEAFVTALIDMIDHPEKRVAIGKEAEKIKDSLSIETIAKQWESLF